MKSNKVTNLLIAGSLSFGAMFSVAAPMQVNAASVKVTATTTKPGYPLNFKATTTQAQVSLAWSKATGATSYIVKRNGVQVYEGSAISFVDKKVTDNTNYTYVLYSKNAKGLSTGVSLNAKTKAIPLPSIPANFKAIPAFNQVNLSWEKGTNATTYQVLRNGTKVYEGSATSFVDKGLAVGTSYTYTVISKNKTGISASAVIKATTTGVPSAPTNVKAVPSFNDATISWSKPSTATSYEVQRNGVKVYEGAALTFKDSGLNVNTSYNYTVIAKNQAGNSVAGKVTTKTIGAPATPILSKISNTSNSVEISWNSVPHASSYEVLRNGVKVFEGTALVFKDTTVKEKTSYIYTVIAKNKAGASQALIQAVTTPALEKPATPTGFKATPATDKVTLTWNKSARAESYEVFRDGVSIYKGNAVSFVDTKVKANTNYVYTIQATNKAGTTGLVRFTAKTLVAKPAQPGNFKGAAVYGKVTLTWSSAANAESYEVFRNGVSIFKGAKLSFVDTTVKENTSYTYTIVAKNKGGDSTAAKVTIKSVSEKQHLINTINASYKGSSIVDYLNAAKHPSSFAERQKLATKLGIKNYTGTAAQNAEMLKVLRSNGK